MDKKTIIGVVLMAAIFIGYVMYSSKQQAEYQAYLEQAQTEQAAIEAAEAEAAAAEAEQKASMSEAELVQMELQRQTELFGESLVAARQAEVKEFTMSNDYLTVDFTTRGGMMSKVTLEEYTKYAPKGERNEKVVLYEPESAMFDMEFYVKKDLKNVPVNTAEYVFTSNGVERGEGFQRLVMSLEVSAGAYLHYEYVLYDEKSPARDYMLDFNVKLENLSPIMASQSTLGMEWVTKTYQNERGFKNENTYTTLSYRFPDENDVEDLGMSEENKSKDVQSEVNWIAFKQQFFSEVFIAHNNFTYADMGFVTAPAGSGFIKTYTARVGVAYNPKVTDYAFSIYCGPNKYAVLSKVRGKDDKKIAMERLIPLGGWLVGWFNRYIVIPVMDFLHKYIASFGLIILILTILVKLLILPLTYKSYLSTAKMRVIKPEMDALNAKYPRQEDAMKKQQEMMNIYKKAGINPMGGCLPMLIQLPLLWALFRFFPSSIELRGQSFLWVDDLSSYDSILNLPFNIPWYGDHVSLFCLLMCFAMMGFSYFTYQQQGASNQPGMAGMKFMMVYLMPIMMLFWFNDFASGLCYYYLLSQILTMIIMFSMRRFVDDKKIRAIMDRSASKQKNKKKSKFQLRYEELMRQQEELQRQQAKAKRR
ncbi:MAG: membrane protein insertase YidC [Alistipes sp.]|nr:membrane protein insertase YidC [Alistipes sp.]